MRTTSSSSETPRTIMLREENDGVTHVPQCVLYSEIDNVSSINKGWDVGSGVGW
eukprot:m.334939 g.334939  ORF g.334939 m.334939 type:complete len:54 (-) comp27762_c0_seq2:3248-3409(-)